MVGLFSEKDQKIIDEVSDFIKKTRRFDLIVNSEKANNIFPENTDDTLGHFLAGTLHYFRAIKNTNDLPRMARLTKRWIDYAFDNGVIEEGQGITGKLEDCKKELTVKENELAEISPKFEEVKKERDMILEENKQLKTEIEKMKMQMEKQ